MDAVKHLSEWNRKYSLGRNYRKNKTHSEFLVLEFVIEIGCVLDDVHDLQKIVPELK